MLTKEWKFDPAAYDAVRDAVWAYYRFAEAKGPVAQASALVELANHMSDTDSWLHPDDQVINKE